MDDNFKKWKTTSKTNEKYERRPTFFLNQNEEWRTTTTKRQPKKWKTTLKKMKDDLKNK